MSEESSGEDIPEWDVVGDPGKVPTTVVVTSTTAVAVSTATLSTSGGETVEGLAELSIGQERLQPLITDQGNPFGYVSSCTIGSIGALSQVSGDRGAGDTTQSAQRTLSVRVQMDGAGDTVRHPYSREDDPYISIYADFPTDPPGFDVFSGFDMPDELVPAWGDIKMVDRARISYRSDPMEQLVITKTYVKAVKMARMFRCKMKSWADQMDEADNQGAAGGPETAEASRGRSPSRKAQEGVRDDHEDSVTAAMPGSKK